jgi:hypothetical protein
MSATASTWPGAQGELESEFEGRFSAATLPGSCTCEDA